MYKDLSEVLRDIAGIKEEEIIDREQQIIDATTQLTKIVNTLLDRLITIETKVNALEQLIIEGREN